MLKTIKSSLMSRLRGLTEVRRPCNHVSDCPSTSGPPSVTFMAHRLGFLCLPVPLFLFFESQDHLHHTLIALYLLISTIVTTNYNINKYLPATTDKISEWFFFLYLFKLDIKK